MFADASSNEGFAQAAAVEPQSPHDLDAKRVGHDQLPLRDKDIA
jgi:hypothetical protein